MVSRGALIVFEGLDRVGKSTLARKLVEQLKESTAKVDLFRFPDRTTPVGQLIDEFLKSSNKKVDNHVMHLLFSANRWELATRIKETINQGVTVVLDRYSYSGIAYSVAKQDMDFTWCCQVERGLPQPDLVIFLELAREIQAARPGFGDERFETLDMQDCVRHQYERLIKSSKEKWVRINVESKDPDQVLDELLPSVKRTIDISSARGLGEIDFSTSTEE